MSTTRLDRAVVIGGGPAGLYCATLLKRRGLAARVTLLEQNPADATAGFGLVFSDSALDFLSQSDPQLTARIGSQTERWRDMTLSLRGRPVVIDGIGFAAIGRLQLLRILQQQASAAGVTLRYRHPVDDLQHIDAELIVGADGVNSLLRRRHEDVFQTSLSYYDNKFIWYGTERAFATLTQSFVDSRWGPFNAHHYRYAADRSTFIIECEPQTWRRAGFAELSDEQTRRRCQQVFADVLNGSGLIANRSVWRRFPKLWNRRWWHRQRVLIGDALHSAHFSIGSGTRLALEDAVALTEALSRPDRSLAERLQAYQTTRQPAVEKIVRAADASARWYDTFGQRMQSAPLDFAYDYITRSGRVSDERLRRIAPGFAARYRAGEPPAPR